MKLDNIQLASQFVRNDSYTLFSTNADFHDNVCANVKPHSRILVSTYNVGITDDHTNGLHNFLRNLCSCISVRMLVGINDHHDKNKQIFGTLSTWQKEFKTLEVRLLQKNHVKTILVQTDGTVAGWVGSLNFANITLHEIMIRLTKAQANEVLRHVEHLWTFGKPFRPVHLMNKTKKSK